MARMPILLSQFDRTRGNLPSFPIINMYAEQAPTEEGEVILQSRPGMAVQSTAGSGPIHCLYKHDGVLSGFLFAITGNKLASNGALIAGTVNGSGPFSIAGYEDRIFIAGGGAPQTYNGAALTTVAFPGSANVIKVVVGASRAIFISAATGTFYWSDVLSTTIDSLSFATAESQPDDLMDMLFIDDTLILFGRESVEFWPNTGDANLPFQPLEGRVFEVGILGTGCAAQIGSTFAWVTNTGQVCLGDQNNVISEPWIEAIIRGNGTFSGSVWLFPFQIDGDEFLCLQANSITTLVWHVRSKTWSRFVDTTTPGANVGWGVKCATYSTADGSLFGSESNSNIYQFYSYNVEPNGVYFERRFRAGIPLNSAGITVNNVVMRTNPGHTAGSGVGETTNPTVEMRKSLDGGNTWGSWRSVSLGANSQYRLKVQWTGCGMIGQPGGLFEFRTTSNAPFRVSGVYFNEPYGGI